MAQHKSKSGQHFSKETTQFLGELLKGKNLSLRAQQEVQHSMHAGSSSWVECVNSGIASCQAAPSQAPPLIKVPKPSSKLQQPCAPPPFRPTVRTQQQIQMQAALNPACEMYRGGPPGMDRQAEKDRLAAVFTFGREGVAAIMMHNAATARASNAAHATAKSASVREQLIDQVVDEVTERTQFLEQMKGLLSVEQERSIKAELAQRLNELKLMSLGGKAGGREV